MARWKRFRSGPGDTLVVSLAEEELGFLRCCPSSCARCSTAPPTIRRGERLFPRAYLDPDRGERGDGVAGAGAPVAPAPAARRARSCHRVARARDARQGTAGSSRSMPDEVQAWLGVLNDARLVLGTRLDITEDGARARPRRPGAGGVRDVPVAHLAAGRPGRGVAVARRTVCDVVAVSWRRRLGRRRRCRPASSGSACRRGTLPARRATSWTATMSSSRPPAGRRRGRSGRGGTPPVPGAPRRSTQRTAPWSRSRRKKCTHAAQPCRLPRPVRRRRPDRRGLDGRSAPRVQRRMRS